MIIFFFFNGSHNEGLELNSKTILGKKKKRTVSVHSNTRENIHAIQI